MGRWRRKWYEDFPDAFAHGRPSRDAERHVGPDPGPDPTQLIYPQPESEQLVQPDENRRCIGRATSQTSPGRDLLAQRDLHRELLTGQSLQRLPGQVGSVALLRSDLHLFRLQREIKTSCGVPQLHLVSERNTLHDGTDLVVPVRAKPENVERVVDLGERPEPYLPHHNAQDRATYKAAKSSGASSSALAFRPYPRDSRTRGAGPRAGSGRLFTSRLRRLLNALSTRLFIPT